MAKLIAAQEKTEASLEEIASGFVNDENATDLTGTAVYTVKDSVGETVADLTLAEPGTYTIHLSGITSENYEITMEAGTLTITENGS